MISVINAVKKIRAKYSTANVSLGLDYNNKYYVFEVANIDEGPYLAVNKKTGDVVGFSPAFDVEGFYNALDNRIVYGNNGKTVG